MTAPVGTGDATPLLEVDAIEVAYHRVMTAVQGVSLKVGAGQLVALMGTNGAGKTTVLRAISGFLGLDNARVTAGAIRFMGKPIENFAPHRVTALGIALVPERDKVFDNLTVAENLAAATTPRGERRSALLEMVHAQFPRLAQLARREAGYLSGGERQMLAIGSALMCAPKLLLVDELSQGLAPLIVQELMQKLAALRKELGLTILLVEQNARVALAAADYGYVIENGRIVQDGDAAKLGGHQDIREFYLGQGGAARKSYRDVKQYKRSRRWYG